MSTELSAEDKTGSRTGSRNTKDSPPQRTAPKWPWILIGSIVVVLCIFGAFSINRQPANPDFIEISGRIEAPETYITAGVGTRVQSVRVEEGERVHRGQLLITLDSRALKVKMHATGAEEGLAQKAQDQANQQVERAQQDVDNARAKSRGFFARVFTSKKKKEEEREKLTNEMKTAQMQLMQAKAMLIKSRAAEGEVSSKVSYFSITCPLDGICVTRSVEPGETVAPGQVLLSIIDPTKVYMRGFIPEGNLSQITLGQKAKVILDSPNDGGGKSNRQCVLNARVTAIDKEPSFTPQNIYFKDARIKQVFGLKLSIDQPDGRAKAGMPADAKISLKQGK